jgi:hypothetical protein
MTTNNPTSPREELARIIDPNAFAGVYAGELVTGFVADRQKAAFAKADEWLSRPPVKAASPEGWQLVPVELDEAMVLAGVGAWLGGVAHIASDEWKDFIRSMWTPILAASPRQPTATIEDCSIVQEVARMAYLTGYEEGREDGDGHVDHDAAEEGWGQYLERTPLLATPPTSERAEVVASLEDAFDEQFHAEFQAQFKSSMERFGKVAMTSGPFFDIALKLFSPTPDQQAEHVEPAAWRYRQLHHEIDGPITGWSYVESDPVWLGAHYRWEIEPLYASPPKPPEAPAVAEGWGPIIHKLQHIRIGMLDHYQAATILEKLVRKAQDAAAPNPESQGQGGAS